MIYHNMAVTTINAMLNDIHHVSHGGGGGGGGVPSWIFIVTVSG
jgi:hypothetical protein